MASPEVGTTRGLRYASSVDRTLVHRAAVAEVFVTDGHRTGERSVRVAAQLPPNHAYFGDHLTAPSAVDPLLLLEVARQAGIYGGHLLGIPLSSVMLISASTLDITAPDMLPPAARPTDLVVDNAFEVTRLHSRRPRSGRVHQELTVDGGAVATHVLEVLVMAHEHHDIVRSAVRSGPVPTTAGLADRPHPEAVPPGAVGRVHPANVVLAAVRRSTEEVTALVAPRFGNRALFDHTYDHLPGAVLTEAARQLALLVAGDPRRRVRGLAARFPRFAELDAPLTAHAPAAPDPEGAVPVVLRQAGTDVATVAVTLDHPGGTP